MSINNKSPLRYPGGKSRACKIIDEIISFLNTTEIKFRQLTAEEINNLIHQERIRKLKNLLKNFFHNRQSKENILRNKLQKIYLIEIINELNTYKKVFLHLCTFKTPIF